jgi:hypothetical protein
VPAQKLEVLDGYGTFGRYFAEQLAARPDTQLTVIMTTPLPLSTVTNRDPSSRPTTTFGLGGAAG